MPVVVVPIAASVFTVAKAVTVTSVVLVIAARAVALVIAVARAVALVITAAIPIALQAIVKLTAIVSVQFLGMDLLRLILEQLKTMRFSFLQVIPPSQPTFRAVALAISMAAASMLVSTIMELTKMMKACKSNIALVLNTYQFDIEFESKINI